jgi:hypothetical protein
MTTANGSARLPEHIIVLVTIDDREAGLAIARAVVGGSAGDLDWADGSTGVAAATGGAS